MHIIQQAITTFVQAANRMKIETDTQLDCLSHQPFVKKNEGLWFEKSYREYDEREFNENQVV